MVVLLRMVLLTYNGTGVGNGTNVSDGMHKTDCDDDADGGGGNSDDDGSVGGNGI